MTNDGIVNETLDFGDGTSPQMHNSGVADFNTEHFYNKPGTFLATLKVTTNSTCAETYTDTVKVHPTPHPVIAVTSPLCTGIITFAGTTTNAMTEPVSWAWIWATDRNHPFRTRPPAISPAPTP
ncbi:PKD domain-containing protein [Puia sp. P3]|uniref:PKD domain-containing protein n=1 Tax=Puia sp. P3 TaxID=3423952 RepID=UPI003D66C413